MQRPLLLRHPVYQAPGDWGRFETDQILKYWSKVWLRNHLPGNHLEICYVCRFLTPVLQRAKSDPLWVHFNKHPSEFWEPLVIEGDPNTRSQLWDRLSVEMGGHWSLPQSTFLSRATTFCTHHGEMEGRLEMPALYPNLCVQSLVATGPLPVAAVPFLQNEELRWSDHQGQFPAKLSLLQFPLPSISKSRDFSPCP